MKLIRHWEKISLLGADTVQNEQDRRSIILLNRISTLSLPVFFVMAMVMVFRFNMWPVAVIFIAAAICMGVSLRLNSQGKTVIARMILPLLMPGMALTVSIFSKAHLHITEDVIMYLMPRFVIIIAILLSLLMFGYREIRYTLMSASVGVFFFFAYDRINRLFGIDYENLQYISTHYPIYVFGTVMFTIFISLGIWTLQSVNTIYEKKIESQNNHIKLKNAELEQQKEEIQTQAENLEKANASLSVEKEKSEKLLLNILPKETADELKENGKAIPRRYHQASVLFTDFKGFTLIAEQLSTEELVADLDHCFKAFDKIAKKNGLEKIKTIGDAYMCAGGLPAPNLTHARDAVAAGLEMQLFIEEWGKQKRAEGKTPWQLRVGIHTGSVIAGVVGQDKFAYDIWGDTVNIAARMESSGEAGRVNISADTRTALGALHATHPQTNPKNWSFKYRGKIAAKNKGEIEMYFVGAE